MMKRRFIAFAAIPVILLTLSCSGMDSPKTSLVTITVGNSGSATLQAGPMTSWTRVKRYFAGWVQTNPALAAIPTNVTDVRLTVTAADMTTMVTTIPVAGLPDVTITIEVPNGPARTFLVEGLDAAGFAVYSGQTTADLTGEPVALTITLTIVPVVNEPIVNPADTTAPTFAGLHLTTVVSISSTTLSWDPATDNLSPSANITYLVYQSTTPGGEVFTAPTYTVTGGATSLGVSNLIPGTTYYFVVRAMDQAGNIDTNTAEFSFVYPGLYVNAATGNDANLCTQGAPCLTIERALAVSGGNEGIFISAGTYTTGTTMQLKPGTQLACTGQNHSTVISSVRTGGPAILGNQGALIDGCRIIDAPSASFPLISDNLTDTSINNCLLEGNGTFSTAGISLSRNSTVTKSVISGYVFNASPGDAIIVSAGNAVISNNTFTANFNGVNITGGAPSVSNNAMTNNTNGIVISGGTTTATITGNTIRSNSSIGISLPVGAGGPTANITSNSIDHNTTGISIQAGTVTATGNSLYCNNREDVAVFISTGVNVTNNSWDHATPSTQGVSAGPCLPAGMDICAYSLVPIPNTVPLNAVVISPCP